MYSYIESPEMLIRGDFRICHYTALNSFNVFRLKYKGKKLGGLIESLFIIIIIIIITIIIVIIIIIIINVFNYTLKLAKVYWKQQLAFVLTTKFWILNLANRLLKKHRAFAAKAFTKLDFTLKFKANQSTSIYGLNKSYVTSRRNRCIKRHKLTTYSHCMKGWLADFHREWTCAKILKIRFIKVHSKIAKRPYLR